MVSEIFFNSMGVPMDSSYHCYTFCCDFGIRNENRQCSKCLSTDKQVEERKDSVLEEKMVVYRMKLEKFQVEDKVYEGNKI